MTHRCTSHLYTWKGSVFNHYNHFLLSCKSFVKKAFVMLCFLILYFLLHILFISKFIQDSIISQIGKKVLDYYKLELNNVIRIHLQVSVFYSEGTRIYDYLQWRDYMGDHFIFLRNLNWENWILNILLTLFL